MPLQIVGRGNVSTPFPTVLRPVILGLIILGFVDFAGGQIPESKRQAIEDLAQDVMTQWNVPGMAIAIVEREQVLMAQGFGVRRLGQPERVDQDTLFAIASNSKAFVAAGLAILVSEGKLKWDDRATDHLPELRLYDPVATQEITVRDLVSHRSGLGTFSGDLLWYGTTYQPQEILRRARFLKPTHGFRDQYGYQNLMFIAAGQIVERVSGQPCDQFVRQRILVPLQMKRTTTSVRDFEQNVASPHNESGGQSTVADDPAVSTLRVLPHGNVDNCWGACGLNSSAADLSRWLQLQLGQGTLAEASILSSQQIWEMWQPNISLKLSPSAMRANPTRQYSAYGLGWFLWNYQGRRVIGHGGGLDGMISQTAFLPEDNLGIVVLTNSESPVATILRDSVLDILLEVDRPTDWNGFYRERYQTRKAELAKADQEWQAARIPGAPPTRRLDDYCGTYRCPMYGDVQISQEEQRLVMRLVPAPDFVADLEHWHYNCFQLKWRPSVSYNFPRGHVNFTINARGESDRMVIDQPNDDFWFYELDLRRVSAATLGE
jgi:CubicO group peptidase (beta-lactamase class C family)